MSRKFMLLLLVLMLGLAACNGNGDDTEPDEPAAGEDAGDSEGDTAGGEATAITAVDYEFQNVPETIAAGTELTIDNQGGEPHELVVFHIPDAEERSVQELLALPDDEEPAIDFVGVAIQLTDGSEVFTPEGPVVVDQPGRYAMVCFFPVGMTDEALQEAMAQQEEGAEGPPPFPDGPPHFTEGMWAEFRVE